MRANELISRVEAWAKSRLDVQGLAVVGSYANGIPTPESDVDLIALVTDPEYYVSEHDWVGGFGQATCIDVERWGQLTAVRVFFDDGPEVEFGFTTPMWCAVPVDPGTRQVVASGCRVLLDPLGHFAMVLSACRNR